MSPTSRCPFCGALLDVTWARSHAPKCPALPSTPTTTPTSIDPVPAFITATRDPLDGIAELADALERITVPVIRWPWSR